MAGDLKAKYGTQGTLTFTTFNSLAGSSGFTAGASSLAVDNTTALALDYLLASKITWSATAPAAGTYQLDLSVYSNLNDTPDYPLDGSGNALGTDIARTFAQDKDKFNSVNLLKSLQLHTTANKVYTMSAASIKAALGMPEVMPKFWGLFATHGVTTASSTPAATGNTFWYMPVLQQYT
jgi:hypothetical protein